MSQQEQLSQEEQQAVVLVEQLKMYRKEASKWQLLVDEVDNEAAKQIAECYRDVWKSQFEKGQAQLKDLDAQINLQEQMNDGPE